MNAITFHMSVQGVSHIRDGRECQDASDSYHDERCSIAIVCDGHGGTDYIRSAAGSKFGCAVARKNIKEFLDGTDGECFFQETEKRLRRLEESIISAWNEEVKEHFARNPFTEEELSVVSGKRQTKYQQGREIEHAYGTTMIAVAVTPEYWFGIHIGDGKCVMADREGVFSQPIPWDPRCFLNSTTSICDMDAIEYFRHYYSRELPAAVFVGSDGIDDCFGNEEQLNHLYRTVLYSFSTSCAEEAEAGLRDYLPRLSAKGSEDDVSVAAILDMDRVPELEMVKSFDREKEKSRLQEKARMEEEARQQEKARMEEEARQQERARMEEEAKLQERARMEEETRQQERARMEEDAEQQERNREEEESGQKETAREEEKAGLREDIPGKTEPGNTQRSDAEDIGEAAAEESAIRETEENPGQAEEEAGLTGEKDPCEAAQGEDTLRDTVQEEAQTADR